MIGRTQLSPGLDVSQLGFGAMALTQVYGGTDDESAIATVHHAIDAGVTLLDTADVYGTPRDIKYPTGANETLLGKVLASRRQEVQIATKFGITRAADGERPTAGDRDYVRQACDASLRRLGVEAIDIYYMHRRELDRPIEETVSAMAELVAEGKVRFLGLCEVTASELQAAHAVHPIAAVQSEWSIWSRDVERAVVPTCAELGIGFVPYSPLGRGFLTGAMTREQSQTALWKGQPRFDDNFEANQAVVDVVRSVAQELSATPAQVALAWLLAQGDRQDLPVVPIPGTRRAARIDENVGATDLALSEAQLATLDAAADLVIGGRNLAFASEEWISAGRE